MNEQEQCPVCHGEGGGYVRVGDDDWNWEPCDRCRGVGYRPLGITVGPPAMVELPEKDADRMLSDYLASLVEPTYTVSDRGFIQFDYIDLGEDRRVRVYESSAASEAKVWLRLVDGEGMACAQLTLDQARQLADQLIWLSEHHHMVAVVDGTREAAS